MALILVLANKENSGRLNSLLVRQGYQTVVAADREDGLLHMEEEPVDLVLLQLGPVAASPPERRLARASVERDAGYGFQAKEEIRRLRDVKDVPVLVILAEEGLQERDWLRAVNDFVVEPYRNSELAARIHRLLGPASGESQNVMSAGDLLIDGDKYQVYLANRPVPLTFKEFELLRFLASHPGKVFSRQALLNQVWGYDYFGGERTVDVHIRRLRSKIEDSQHSFIDTVRNVGYRFKS